MQQGDNATHVASEPSFVYAWDNHCRSGAIDGLQALCPICDSVFVLTPRPKTFLIKRLGIKCRKWFLEDAERTWVNKAGNTGTMYNARVCICGRCAERLA